MVRRAGIGQFLLDYRPIDCVDLWRGSIIVYIFIYDHQLHCDCWMGKIYPVLVLNATFLPLQGLFNVFIYLKPTYIRFRAANPNKSMYFVLHQALFNPEVPQLDFSSDQSGSNAIAEGDVGNPNQALFNSNFRPRSSSSDSSSSGHSSSNAIGEG